MKTLKAFVLVLLFGIVIPSCNDKEDDDKNSSKEIQLEQTNWGGKMVTTTLDEVLEYNVGISFYTFEIGFYDLIPINKEDPTIKNDFSYSIDREVLFIKGNPFLKGYWFIEEYNGNSLILKQGTEGGISKSVLTLSRTN